jgi:hypothetical protein
MDEGQLGHHATSVAVNTGDGPPGAIFELGVTVILVAHATSFDVQTTVSNPDVKHLHWCPWFPFSSQKLRILFVEQIQEP